MAPAKRFNRNLIAAAHDAAMAGISFLLSIWLRLGENQIYMDGAHLRTGTILFTLVCVTVFVFMRLYRGLWRYASMRDMLAIVKAVSLSVLVFAALMFIFNRLEGLPRSVLFINWMLLIFMLGAPRFAYRAIKDRTLFWQMTLEEAAKIPVLMIGADDNAERFIRDMARDVRAPYQVVGIVDNNTARHGRMIHRVPIYGGTDILRVIVNKLARKGKRPQKILISDDKMDGTEIRHLLDLADNMGIPLARLPKPSEFKSGLSEKPDIIPIDLEDLLGRPQNVLDRDSMRAMVENRTVLVTGAGGTIGGELTRQIACYRPKRLVLFEMSEFNLYQIEREIRDNHLRLDLETVLGDVRDAAHVQSMFAKEKPDLVFHAAAIKHVPLSEDNVEEAILTNVFGTKNIADCCQRAGTSVMVMISTDKAVNPANVMGASKRLAENVCQSMGEAGQGSDGTRFITVRFGNVLGSTGSVVPLFQEQLARGGPLTVTHPDVTRYFMTTREAVELVMQAAALGAGMRDRRECIFVLDMGQPVRILDLAVQIIRLAGLKPYEDIKIQFIGLRPGEKLYEELFHHSEGSAKTAHTGIYLASPRCTGMDQLEIGLARLLSACQSRNAQAARTLLKELVPEFQAMHIAA